MFQTTNQECSIEIVDLPMNKNGDFPIRLCSKPPSRKAVVSNLLGSTIEKIPGFRLWDGHKMERFPSLEQAQQWAPREAYVPSDDYPFG